MAVIGGRYVPRRMVRSSLSALVNESTTANFTDGGDNLSWLFDVAAAQADHNELPATAINGQMTFGWILDVLAWQDDPGGDATLDVFVNRYTVAPSRKLVEMSLVGPGILSIKGLRMPSAHVEVQWGSNAFSVGNAALGVYVRNR